MELRKAIDFQSILIAMQGLIALIMAGMLFYLIISGRESQSGATIENTASPEFSNQVTTGSELDHIKERAERRGYYYQSEFAEVMGVSEKTIQRRIDSGRLNPLPGTDSEGRIRIELETEVLPSR